MNPYKILGIKQGADEETIKKAYRELVKKYHPDQYANNPLSELASEKLKEINEAYDMLINKKSASNNSNNSYNKTEYSGNASYFDIRSLIQSGRIEDADLALESITIRNAEWHYLKGLVYLNKGWYDRAVNHLNQAVNLDPSNIEYRQALNSIYQRNQGYRNFGGGGMGNSSACNCCTQLVCADCCCECMGGDLISCC